MEMELNKININKIRKFWIWFYENCQNFGTDYSNTELLDILDTKISELGNLTWEVGPGKTANDALVISPNGDLELLPYTKEIIANAKECTDWEYYYAKPPKQWGLIFDFETTDSNQIEINASIWEYVLLKYKDGMFEIIIKAVNIDALSADDKLTAAEILLDGILGEELRMTAICSINIVLQFEEVYKNKASNIKNLSNHINSLLK